GGKVGTDEANPLLWTLAAYAVLRIVKGGDPRLWLLAGGALGLAFETKYSVVLFGAALLGGLVLVPQRRVVASPWFAAGAALCAALALPNALWQLHEGLPMLELLRNGQNGKNVVVGPLAYLAQEVLITDPFLAPVWIIGLVQLVRTPSARFLALAYVLLIAEMIVLHGKHYYHAAIYPIPIAAGCVALEAWTALVRFVRPVLAVVAVFAGLVFTPMALPVLPEPAYLAYEARVSAIMHIHLKSLAMEHHPEDEPLPADWADMHGWPELAATVERVVASLPPADRERALIVTSNYGEASALVFFGHDLPPVASGHNEFWLWGTHGRNGDLVIDVHGDCGADDHLFAHAERAATFSSPYGISYEQNVPIMVCRGIRTPLATLWPSVRHYI
ncbi:MAG: glycosyltransferase family 39 protein, partial [Candidatus Eremiobacteraeota bacterium]|nr:glycosyltransferase family 39 protein [Candidatus Eremiobacteraeota bacterium]